jgi:hypothetical protein
MPAALFFLSAIKGGDLSQWMGQKANDAIQKAGKNGPASRLMQESQAMNRIASENSHEWRSMVMPFYYEGAFQKVVLHSRKEQKNQQDEDSNTKAVRFIFDLKYNGIGDVQLDGLFRMQKQSGRLDVILRTQQHFSSLMQADMRRIYTGAIEQAGISGELSFQNALQNWVTIDYKQSAFGKQV